MSTMRTSLLHAPGELEIRDVPMLEPQPGELIARVDLAMTCGTDLKTFRRGHPIMPLPMALGHEFTGHVERVGEGVTRFKQGDPVLVAPSGPCTKCDPCRRGLENLCDHINGRTMAWGAFAECIRIPAHVVRRNVMPRPAGLDLRHAALLEPLSCVVAGVARLDLTRTDTVAVLGAGPIGLLFVALLKRRGVSRVILVGKREIRLAAAAPLGADDVLDLDVVGNAVDAVRELVPEGVCTVVECVGQPVAWEQAMACARKGGEVLFYGGCASGTSVPLDTRRMHYDALTLKGAFHFTPSDVRIALDLIQSKALPLERLVTGERPLEELPEAFEALIAGKAIKLAINPNR